MAYFFLYRHADLVLKHLPTHPQAKDPKYHAAWIEARKAVKHDLGKLESLKPAINQRYERYIARLQARTTARAAHNSISGQQPWNEYEQLADGGSSSSRQDQAVNPSEHPDLAVQLANLEVQRRLRKQRPVTITTEDDINLRLREVRRQLDRASTSYLSQSTPSTSTSSYNYPAVPQTHSISTSNSMMPQEHRPQPPTTTGPRPPPKDRPYASSGPPVPTKEKLVPSQTTPPTTSAGTHQFAANALLESGLRLRTMFLPLTLRQRFVNIAESNTRSNLETLGILTGTLIQNALFITKLVIPEQISTSDTCEMLDELALYEWTTTQPENLMVLGWIHTHPTQTCFLSSRDLHTHFPFQATLAESVAIVCSPSRQPEYGVFRLTDPPGLPAIKACKQTATFHPHEQTHIFTDALGHGGHVIEHADLHFDVVDLRPKK